MNSSTIDAAATPIADNRRRGRPRRGGNGDEQVADSNPGAGVDDADVVLNFEVRVVQEVTNCQQCIAPQNRARSAGRTTAASEGRRSLRLLLLPFCLLGCMLSRRR